MDVISMYLAGDLDEIIYMESPDGFNSYRKVLQLLKSLYELKQLAQIWNHRLWDHLVANGYKQLYSDYGLYFNEIILITAYIDNLAMAGPKDLKAIMEAKRMLESAFN